MRNKTWLALAAGLLVSAAWAANSGPEAGSGAPMIHIDAANDDAGEYCVTCRAGLKPTVVAFVAADSEDNRKLIAAVAEAAKTHHDHGLHTAVVFTGTEDHAHAILGWMKEHELMVPFARVAPDAADLKPWMLNAEVKTTTVFIKDHKVAASVADIKVDDVQAKVGEIVG